ncbi:MAG: corrinoid protein [Clostridia bacterium]|nr:corrinoid protein [Christensenellaceae bacterium]MBR6239647.1 corrinoid protein [Clostridia bacterium]
MGTVLEIRDNIISGRAKAVTALITQALEEGIPASVILNDGLLEGMGTVGERFKNDEIFVPEVLISARAMNKGIEILKPYLSEGDTGAKGTAVIGTVRGDMHDIGKNLVKMMIEGRGIKVIDLGTDVSPEAFYDAAIENNADIVCCSALLTTTMVEMKNVVDLFVERGMRDKVKIMIGGAPTSQEFCDEIGADCYTSDAASAAEAALAICQSIKQ